MTTIGAFARNDSPMSVIATGSVCANASGVSMPGTRSTTGAPGLNPSLVLISVGSTGVPPALVGIEAVFRSSRMPVGVESSGRV